MAVMWAQRGIKVAVKTPSPQPRSRICSCGWGESHCVTLDVRSGTKEEDALYAFDVHISRWDSASAGGGSAGIFTVRQAVH